MEKHTYLGAAEEQRGGRTDSYSSWNSQMHWNPTERASLSKHNFPFVGVFISKRDISGINVHSYLVGISP